MIGDHPDIARALETGYPNGTPTYPECPVCGAECETIFKDKDGYIFGCDCCIKKVDAWECEDAFPSEEEY